MKLYSFICAAVACIGFVNAHYSIDVVLKKKSGWGTQKICTITSESKLTFAGFTKKLRKECLKFEYETEEIGEWSIKSGVLYNTATGIFSDQVLTISSTDFNYVPGSLSSPIGYVPFIKKATFEVSFDCIEGTFSYEGCLCKFPKGHRHGGKKGKHGGKKGKHGCKKDKHGRIVKRHGNNNKKVSKKVEVKKDHVVNKKVQIKETKLTCKCDCNSYEHFVKYYGPFEYFDWEKHHHDYKKVYDCDKHHNCKNFFKCRGNKKCISHFDKCHKKRNCVPQFPKNFFGPCSRKGNCHEVFGCDKHNKYIGGYSVIVKTCKKRCSCEKHKKNFTYKTAYDFSWNYFINGCN